MRRQFQRIKSVSVLRRAARLVLDTQVFFFSFYVAFWLRLGDEVDFLDPSLALSALLFTAVCIAVFLSLGTELRSWRFFGMRDLVEIIRDSAIVVSVYTLIGFSLSRLLVVPRSVPVIAFFVLVVGLALLRIAYRAYFDGFTPSWLFRPSRSLNTTTARALIFGATQWTHGFLAMLAADPRNTIEAVGIVDDDPANQDRRIHGVKVIATMNELASFMSDFEDSDPPITQLVVTDPHTSRSEMRRIFDAATAVGLTVAHLPRTESLILTSGEVRLEPVKITDLLGRDPVNLDLQGISRLIKGKIVVVTGAGGSIGSELSRQILAREPRTLVLLDHSEFNLFQIDTELSHEAARRGVRLIPKLLSVRDRDHVERAFQEAQVDLVFHAAAYKHVHLIEKNPLEGIWTNVVGTAIVANAARECGAKAMIMVSTDKAVNPTSVMGMTKRAAECYCMALNDESSKQAHGTSFVVVRFGNVLGSSGSVVPIFEQQIRDGGPVTVTHEEVTRYFMTIPEAVQLVLQGSVYALGASERQSAVLVLDMGEPVKIIDLARRMIDTMKSWAQPEIPIKITGLKPGEKLHEELFSDKEIREMTALAGILEARSPYPEFGELSNAVTAIETACLRSDVETAFGRLKPLIFCLDKGVSARTIFDRDKVP